MMPMKTWTIVMSFGVALAFGASEADAQIRPGIERGDYWGEVRARYRSETLEQVGELMESWLASWNEGDATAVAAAFSEDGILVLDGATYRGRDSIEGAFSARDPAQLVQSLADFDVRGEMAFATVRHGVTGGAGATPVGGAGLELWVFVKEDGGWSIRSLVMWMGVNGTP